MVDINRRDHTVRVKILYYGPPTGGKTTNLIVLHRMADPKRRGELVSVNSTQDRTILMDLLPLKTPAFQGFDLRLQVIAVPGQSAYAGSRNLLLKGADSIVFVANSAADRWEETLQSMREMNKNLISHGYEPSSVPVVFQYNKRDLPELTPLEAMDRTLNARHSDSFPAVAIREEGVVETFAAVLRRTMEDLATRYQIGANLRSTRSAKDWADESLRIIFGTKPGAKPATEPTPQADGSATGIKVRVPVRSGPSTPSGPSDPPSEALAESYAEAATKLTLELEELREDRDRSERRSNELIQVLDAAQKLLDGADGSEVFLAILATIGRDISADMGSFSIGGPEGSMEPVALWNLVADPLCARAGADGVQQARLLMERGSPLVFTSGESGPLLDVLDLVGSRCTALVAIPALSSSRKEGLLVFYLSENAPLPNDAVLEHLTRLARALALVLELARGSVSPPRQARETETARVVPPPASSPATSANAVAVAVAVAKRAIDEMDEPMGQLFRTVGRIRQRTDGLPWLLEETLGIGMNLVRAQQLREGVLRFLNGERPCLRPVTVEEVFVPLQLELKELLSPRSIRLELVRDPKISTVETDRFLLHCALVDMIQRSLDRTSRGGLIRVSVEAGEALANFRIQDGSDRALLEDPAVALALADYFHDSWKLSIGGPGIVGTLSIPSTGQTSTSNLPEAAGPATATHLAAAPGLAR